MKIAVAAAAALLLLPSACRRAPREVTARAPQAHARAQVQPAPPTPPAPPPAVAAPCSGPGYSAGPSLKPLAGQPPFTVTFDCMWPTGTRLEVALARSDATPLSRERTEALLRGVWRQLHTSLGKAFPHNVQLCLFPAGTRGWGSDALGCMKQGYEPEGEEGEEDEVEVHIAGTLDAASFARTLARAYGRGLTGAHRPQFTVDSAAHALAVTWPYPDGGGDAHLSFADALVPFFAVAFRFYPAQTDLRALRFVGVWRGKPAVTVRIADEATFLRMQPWPVREALAQARVPYEPGSARTAEQTTALAAAYRDALARLPAGSVTIDPTTIADATLSQR